MIRNENGMLTGYVYVDVAGRDVGGYVAEAKRAGARGHPLPAGYSLAWSGQYEAMERVRERLKIVLPLTLFLIFLLLYLNTKSADEDADRDAGGAVLGGRRDLAALPARLQHEHRGLGGADRADGRGRGDGRLHAALPRPGVRRGEERGPHAQHSATCARRSCTAP